MAGEAPKLKKFPGFFPIAIGCIVLLYAPMIVISAYRQAESKALIAGGKRGVVKDLKHALN